MLAVGYLTGAALVALAVYAAVRFTQRRDLRGPSRLVLTAMAAGLVWPLFLMGVVQFGLIFAISRVVRWFVGAPTSCRPTGGVSRPAAAFVDAVR